jgi:type I restriction enzyme M protein
MGGEGQVKRPAVDLLGRVYEYFLAQFASAEGKKGGQFYTPSRVVRVLVEMLAPYKGRVYDPCCGSGGMFVSSEKFIEAHSGKLGDISIYGQESNYTTWRLAKMNLAIRGIDAQIAHGDAFHNDRHPDPKADYVLATPPSRLSARVWPSFEPSPLTWSFGQRAKDREMIDAISKDAYCYAHYCWAVSFPCRT